MASESSSATSTTFTESIQHMLTVTQELHDCLQSLTSTNSSLRFYCTKLLTKLHEFTKAFAKLAAEKCGICFEGPKNYCLYPCGHIMCETCCTRCITDNSCFVCRAVPQRSIKTFG